MHNPLRPPDFSYTDSPSADGKPPCGQTGASIELGKDSLRFELRVVWKEALLL